MNIIKKSISVLLAALLIIGICPMAVSAEEEEYRYSEVSVKDGITYIQLDGYNGYEDSITLPTEIDGKVCVGLDYNFSLNSGVTPTEIIVPEGYDYIAGLRGIKNLSVTLPSSLKCIDRCAFQNSTVDYINFPENLEIIGYEAFLNVCFTENTDIVLPDSLKYVSSKAFYNTNITSIHLGKDVEHADVSEYNFGADSVASKIEYNSGSYSFISNCPYLNKITVDAQNPYYTVDNNILLSKDKSILWYYPAGIKKCNYTTPENVKNIAGYAFYKASFGKFVLSNNVENLGDSAFSYINADSFVFENGCQLTSFPDTVFEYAAIGEPIVIPNTVKSLERGAFSSCNIPAVEWEENSKCTFFDDYAFSNSEIKSITIPASVRNMGSSFCGIFYNCKKLEAVAFEDNSKLAEWNRDLFRGCCSLSTIEIGKNSMLQSINCSLKDTAIEELDFSNCYGLSQISDDCFKNNYTIRKVDLTNTNLSTLSYTFYGCSNLQTVVLPGSLYRIYGNTFSGCSSLENINTENVSIIDSNAFTACDSLKQTPKSATEKSNDAFTYYELENSITIKGPADKSDCLGSIVIPSEIDGKPVTRIGEGAFRNAEAVSLVIPDTVTDICSFAFQYAVIDDGVSIPDSVTHIGERAFLGYQNISNAKYPHESINTGIALPGVKVIGEALFYKSAISDVTVSEGTLFIEKSAFNMTNVESFDIPDSVQYIDDFALNNSKLNSISFGAGVSNIDEYIADSFALFDDDDAYLNCGACIKEYNVSADNKMFASVDGVVYSKDMSTLVAVPCGKSLTDYIFPEKVCRIGKGAFGRYNADSSFTVPYFVSIIDDYAFAYTASLKSVFIPNSVTAVGEYAFAYSKALENAEFDNGVSLPMLNNTFFGCTALTNVSFGNNCSVPKLIGTFEKSGIEFADLNCNVIYMEKTFFDSSIKEINLYDKLEEIGSLSFCHTPLEKIVMPKTVKKIGGRAFEGCEKLYYVNLSNVTALEYAAFKDCTGLESIDLTGVYYICNDWSDVYVFFGCTNLKKFCFTAEEKQAYIAENEFQGDKNIETVVISNSITEIKDRAFADCTNLQTAFIADEVDNISDTAFENCELLTIVCMYNSPAMYYAQRNDIPFETFVISPIPDQNYTGKPITPPLDVKQAGKPLTADKDYTAVYSDNINIGIAKVAVAGLGDYSVFGSTAKFNIIEAKDNNPSVANNPTENNKQSADVQGNPLTDNKPVVPNDSKPESNYSSVPDASTNQPADSTATDSSQGSVSNSNRQNSTDNGTGTSNNNASNDGAADNSNAADTNNNRQPVDSAENTDDGNTEEKDNFFVRVFKAIAEFFKTIFNIIKSLF